MRTRRPLPSQGRLNELFEYNPETGILTWRSTAKMWHSKRFSGKRAGSDHGRYRHISIDGNNCYEHRIIYKMIYNLEPNYIDHINGDGHDNRLVNIREATQEENLAHRPNYNRKLPRGVTARKKRFIAQISVNYEHFYLGMYGTPEEAHDAYCKAAKVQRAHHFKLEARL